MNYSQRPLKLCSNRVWRTYQGGSLIEQWYGSELCQDSWFPEEWIASVVRARNPGRENIENEGLSQLYTDDSRGVLLKELIDADAVAYLGKEHIEKYGSHMGVLIKILDSAERLTIQVHPDRQTAKRYFNSDYGKTEAWYILGGREINGEPPYILVGFKSGMTKEKWIELFKTQNISAMTEALHKFYVKPGQVFLIEGGLPHAIGPGCFLIEIQEPTDYTIRVERTTPTGLKVPDLLCHQGIGFENMFACFHFHTWTKQQIIDRLLLRPAVIHNTNQAKESILINREDTMYFGMNEIKVYNKYFIADIASFSVVIVLSGCGIMHYGGGAMDVTQGDQVFIPAGVKGVLCTNLGERPLQIIRCFPPL